VPAYVIGQLREITDSEAFWAYQDAVGPTLAPYGGKPVVKGTKIEAVDGGWNPIGMVVVEFESAERAREWYDPPEYQTVIGQRFNSADSAVIIVDGD